MTPITHRNREIERLERELAAKDAQIMKLTSQLRAVKDFNKVHQEQHAQSRENAKLLYTTLRRSAPDALKSIEGALWQNTTEYDKLMSEGRRWQEKCQRSERELAESREECRRLQSQLQAVTEIVRSEMLFRPTNLTVNAYRLAKHIAATLAPKAGDK